MPTARHNLSAVALYQGTRDERRIVVDGPPQLKLREAEYLWQTSSYILWPAAARELLKGLISTLEGAFGIVIAASSISENARMDVAQEGQQKCHGSRNRQNSNEPCKKKQRSNRCNTNPFLT